MPNIIDNWQNQSVHAGLQANAPLLRLLSQQSMGASFVSSPIDMSAANSSPDPSWEFQAVGTGAGTFTWEASNSYDPGANPGATFITILDANTSPSLAGAAPAGANKSYIGSISRTGVASARWWRLRYAFTSGAGVVDAWVYLRGVGR